MSGFFDAITCHRSDRQLLAAWVIEGGFAGAKALFVRNGERRIHIIIYQIFVKIIGTYKKVRFLIKILKNPSSHYFFFAIVHFAHISPNGIGYFMEFIHPKALCT